MPVSHGAHPAHSSPTRSREDANPKEEPNILSQGRFGCSLVASTGLPFGFKYTDEIDKVEGAMSSQLLYSGLAAKLQPCASHSTPTQPQHAPPTLHQSDIFAADTKSDGGKSTLNFEQTHGGLPLKVFQGGVRVRLPHLFKLVHLARGSAIKA